MKHCFVVCACENVSLNYYRTRNNKSQRYNFISRSPFIFSPGASTNFNYSKNIPVPLVTSSIRDKALFVLSRTQKSVFSVLRIKRRKTVNAQIFFLTLMASLLSKNRISLVWREHLGICFTQGPPRGLQSR